MVIFEGRQADEELGEQSVLEPTCIVLTGILPDVLTVKLGGKIIEILPATSQEGERVTETLVLDPATKLSRDTAALDKMPGTIVEFKTFVS